LFFAVSRISNLLLAAFKEAFGWLANSCHKNRFKKKLGVLLDRLMAKHDRKFAGKHKFKSARGMNG
jgi:hypothetical protein